MFDRLARSWEYTKISYGIIWDFKSLLIFPLLSGFALLLVLASFLLPLWGMGTLEAWANATGSEGSQATSDPLLWVVTFLFYFCNYFVIVFFNSALIGCAMTVMRGEEPTVGDGLLMAAKRFPQIIAWAFISALVGVVLKAIENSHKKAGAIIASILGTGWSIMTYFAVPVLVMEGVGPVEAIKRSVTTMKATWGESLGGYFSLGLISFLLFLPVVAVLLILGFLAANIGSGAMFIGVIVLGVVLMGLHAVVTSAADTIFRALLYSYASGRVMPENVDADVFAHAFGPRGE